MMNPWKENRQLKQLVEVLNHSIELHNQKHELQRQMIESLQSLNGVEANRARRELDEKLAEIDKAFCEGIGIRL
jgi:hypothetical protein